ncbi:MAG: helix-turn-helix domain-containing protein [Bacteroidales bacterium]
MKDRLRRFLTQEGISPSQFADEIGVQRSAISHILSGRNYPSYDIIVKILTRYKRLSPDWLLLGTGNMYRSDAKATVSNDIDPVPYFSRANQPVIPQNSEKIEQDDTSKNVESGNSSQLSTFVNKAVERIVIFYDDHTFESYVPHG